METSAVNSQFITNVSPVFTKTVGVSTFSEFRFKETENVSASMLTTMEQKAMSIINIRFIDYSLTM